MSEAANLARTKKISFRKMVHHAKFHLEAQMTAGLWLRRWDGSRRNKVWEMRGSSAAVHGRLLRQEIR
jgi:hypothetical protein